MSTFWLRLFALPIAGLAACVQPIDEVPLSSGLVLGEWLASSDTAVVFIIDPATCFSCLESVSFWLARARADSSVLLVFTRRPTEEEAIPLRIQRMKPEAKNTWNPR